LSIGWTEKTTKKKKPSKGRKTSLRFSIKGRLRESKGPSPIGRGNPELQRARWQEKDKGNADKKERERISIIR